MWACQYLPTTVQPLYMALGACITICTVLTISAPAREREGEGESQYFVPFLETRHDVVQLWHSPGCAIQQCGSPFIVLASPVDSFSIPIGHLYK